MRTTLFLGSSVVYVLSLIGSFLHQGKSAVVPGFTNCVFNGRHYALWETFHPMVDIGGHEYVAVCYNCTCQPTGIAQCEETHCLPTTCLSPIRLEGQCCPVCNEPVVSTGPQYCLYDGLNIPHGDLFHPPSMYKAFEEEMNEKQARSNGTVSAKDISVNPFCTQCECKNGSVECEDVSSECPALSCSFADAFLGDGKCCMECPATSPAPVEVCIDFDGTLHFEGETWNPYYPGFGQVPCINCTCINGSAQCRKAPCPEVPFCEPNDPIPEIELCCLKCQPRPRVQATLPPPTEQGVTSSTDHPILIPEETTTEEIGSSPNIVPCTKVDYIINIFKHTNMDAMALENTLSHQVEVYNWSLSTDGSLMKEITTMTSVEFREQFDPMEYVFIGKTVQRRVNGLTNRAAKREKIRRCRDTCSNMVVNMLRPMTAGINCSS